MNLLKSNLKIGKRIGGGFFGEVHVATDDVHGEVAVKILRQQPGESAADWAQRKAGLIREGQHLSQAAHPNVVRVYQLLESDQDDAIHLVMELCAGGSLQPVYEAGPMPLADLRRIATEVCQGLDALHSRGMLHRDIKPGNTLISATNTAQIGDFGLVTDDIILGYGSQAGYSDHIAIEVWNGAGTSVRSDIWALGMTIYRLIHGAEWYSQLPADPRNIIRHGGFALSLPWLPHVPDSWRRFIRKMMHDDPAHRYQNAQQVMNALAGLETAPNWSCTISPNETRWEAVLKGRRRVIRWTKHSQRKFEWEARSEPLGAAGKTHRLGGSAGIVGHAQSERQLKAFFST